MSQESYWEHKISLWLHDPVDKTLHIPGHERRAQEVAELLSVPWSREEHQVADWLATGLTRAVLPAHDRDVRQSGSVDFLTAPVLCHPLVPAKLRFDFSSPTDGVRGDGVRGGGARVDAEQVHQQILAILRRDLGLEMSAEALARAAESGIPPLAAHFWSDPSRRPSALASDAVSSGGARESPTWHQALFAYLFFVLRERLVEENVGGLGQFWHVLPADTRMPDHSIWHHLGMVSAIGSCRHLDPKREVSLAVFSLTPVQSFISKARKLRDHWVASNVLSYLAFSGIRHVMETLGPDHVVYPSLHRQPLVAAWLRERMSLSGLLPQRSAAVEAREVASFPNKFVFLCPTSQATFICREIESAVLREWESIGALVQDLLRTGTRRPVGPHFETAVKGYFRPAYAAVRLLRLDALEHLAKILHRARWEKEARLLQDFARGVPAQQYGQLGRLYGATHALAQSLLAADKLLPDPPRAPQHGEKCPLCGEHEVLHDFDRAGATSAREYASGVRSFWDAVREAFNFSDEAIQVGERERLCAVCTIKRLLPFAVARPPEAAPSSLPYLRTLFSDGHSTSRPRVPSFPSTTEIALQRFVRALRNAQVGFTSAMERELYHALHQIELDELASPEAADETRANPVAGLRLSDEMSAILASDEARDLFRAQDRYYALLLMDGDRMGDLINGVTVSAVWSDVIHPTLSERFTDADFQPTSALRPHLRDPRTINPAVHAAISDALNTFARQVVAPVVRRAGGRLIYAGGDDVCAMLPLDGAVQVAQALSTAYGTAFAHISEDSVVQGRTQARPHEPIACLLGGVADRSAEAAGASTGISISGALLLAHHKQPLREVLSEGHRLLEAVAKGRAGRNALAIRLWRRAGHYRTVWFNWQTPNPFYPDETLVDSFRALVALSSAGEVSTKFLYHASAIHDLIVPLADQPPHQMPEPQRRQVVDLFRLALVRSGSTVAAKATELRVAERVAGLCVRDAFGRPDWYQPDAPVIAQFWGQGSDSFAKEATA